MSFVSDFANDFQSMCRSFRSVDSFAFANTYKNSFAKMNFVRAAGIIGVNKIICKGHTSVCLCVFLF